MAKKKKMNPDDEKKPESNGENNLPESNENNVDDGMKCFNSLYETFFNILLKPYLLEQDVDKQETEKLVSDCAENISKIDRDELKKELLKMLADSYTGEECNGSSNDDEKGKNIIGIFFTNGCNPSSESLVQERATIGLPEKYDVVFHNDDYTPMGFVVEILVKLFNRKREDAVHLMMYIHENGKGIAGTYVKSIAEVKVMLVRKMAQEAKYPLHVTMEKSC